jgi:transposase InsO family protein
MGMPELVVAAVLEQGRSKSEVARTYGVSRRWVITLVQRFEAEGPAGLRPRSRRPSRSPTRIPDELADEVIEIRKDLDHNGHEAGPATIAYHLERRHGHAPAVSTIWRVLTKRGFITPEPHKRPKSSYVRFESVQPNERWQSDITHWTLADGTDVEICNWIDDHSRLCLASTTRTTFTASDVDTAFRRAATTWGNPASVLSDNGAVYTGRYRSNGRVRLEITLNHRGITFVHSRPYHPQTCGKVERFHQTEKKWLARQPPVHTLAELQTQLDTFRHYYNDIRPHRALGRRTPRSAYDARPKATPRLEPLDDAHYRVRHDVIDRFGKLTLRHGSRLHHIGLGRRHAGTKVLVLVKDLHIRITTTDGQPLLDLQLDPTRDYQPQPKT